MAKKSNRSTSLADAPMAASVDKASERRYRAQDALHTITRALEHQSDPQLMRDVKKLAAEQAKKMASVAKR